MTLAGPRTFAAVVACALAAAVAEPAHAVDADYYGVNAQFFMNAPAEEWDAHLQAIAATGVGVVRVDAPWGKVEPTAPVGGVRTYRWDRFDALAAALARNNLRWYPTIAYGTLWAAADEGSGWLSPPRDPADYAAFVEAFAARYGSQGSFWAEYPALPRLPVESYEIWNEPNVEKFFFDQATAPERYADLYVPAAAGVRRADPAGRVLIGGLSSVGVDQFLARMQARQPVLWSYVDAVSYHPYGGNADMTFERIGVLRDALTQLGVDQLPIEITETGWASPPSSEEHRAEQMRRLAEGLPRTDCVTRFIPYAWLTDELDAQDPEDWFGIANHDGSLKPSGQAYSAAVLRMLGPDSPVDSGERCSAEQSPGSQDPEEQDRVLLEVPSETELTSREAGRRLQVRLRPGKVRRRSLSIAIDCNFRCKAVIRVAARAKRRRSGIARGQVLLRTKRVRVSDRRIVRIRLPLRRLARTGRRYMGPRRLGVRARVVDVRGHRTEVRRRARVGRRVRRSWARMA